MLIDIHTHVAGKTANQLISSSFPEVLPGNISLGIHPWHIPETIEWKSLEKKLNHPNCVALGECGLDYLCETPFKLQVDAFKKQVSLAEKLELPLVIHCVRAYHELFEIKKQLQSSIPWIIHGFSKAGVYQQLIKLDFYVSFGAAICKESNGKLREVAAEIPLNRVFLETDDQTTFPIEAIYKCFCDQRVESQAEIEAQIEQNVKRTFKKWRIG